MSRPLLKHPTTTQRLLVAMFMLLFVVVVGTIGFMTLERMTPLNALYMTVITLSTVGYGEVTPLDDNGRLFAIILIMMGMGTGMFMASAIGQMVIEGQLRALLGRRKMESRIRKMSNHMILAGYGRVGRQVAQEFLRRRANFLVIEKDEQALEGLIDDGIMHVRGMATDDEVLRQAGIERARTLVSTLPDEAQNVYLTLTARAMSKDLQIIARADYDDGEKKLLRAGANHVISPHVLGGQRMAMACLRPNVVDFMHTTAFGVGGLSIEEIIIPDGSTLSGKTILESRLKQDFKTTIIGIRKADQQLIITPAPNTLLDAGDVLVLIGPTEGLEQLTRRLA